MPIKITASVEETVRTVFRLFQRVSKFARCKAVSSCSQKNYSIAFRKMPADARHINQINFSAPGKIGRLSQFNAELCG